MNRIRLIHWNAAEAKERALKLRAAGYAVLYGVPDATSLKQLRRSPPAAVVIDLARLPAQGRDLAIWLRQSTATRHVPIVFVGGDAEKAVGIRRLVPDAEYTSWRRIRGALRRAIAHPPAHPVVLGSVMAAYSGAPLAKKLGIKPDCTVLLVRAPTGFQTTLGSLPEGATVRRRWRGSADLVVWFTKSQSDLERGILRMAKRIGPGGLWIVWPKKTSGVVTDLTQAKVRRIGLAAGLVDYKICAVDATWSGLRFARRAPG